MAAPRPFLRWPDPRLRTSAAPVLRVDDGVRAAWDEMEAAMRAMPGVGLAGPQIGEMRRLAVVDCSEGKAGAVRMANPRIAWFSSETATREEGSPNLPGLWAPVTRPAAVRVVFADESGAEVERLFTDLWATSVQHQIDHLEGRVFIDRLGPVRRRMALDRWKKKMRREGR